MQLRIRELGPDDVETLTSMNDLAVAYQAVGRLDEAIRAAQARPRNLQGQVGTQHPTTLRTMNNLAMAYQSAGRAPEAIPLFEARARVAEGNARARPPRHSDLHEQPRRSLPRPPAGSPKPCRYWNRLYEGSRATLGPEHPDTLTAMNNLATAYLEAGRLNDAAVARSRKSLNRRKVQQGPDHPDTLITMNNLAAAYQILAGQADAVSLFEEVLALRKVKLGHDHPDTLKSLNNLATSIERPAGPLRPSRCSSRP